ncbi:hypothetical protein [Ekhidna sp.]
MKKVLMIIAFVGMVSLFGCTEDTVEPMQELPVDVQATDGDDDEEPGGQPGGGLGNGGG